MAAAYGSLIGLRRATRGLAQSPPEQGVSRATLGLVNGLVQEEVVVSDEDLYEGLLDANGLQLLLSGEVRDVRFVEVSQQLFANPDREFTGYAADGYWYTSGQKDPSHVPFQATWATEATSAHRGPATAFPDRLLVFTTRKEVVLIDADNITVWMRFYLLATTTSPGNLLGDVNTYLRQTDFSNGVLVVATDIGLCVADFIQDIPTRSTDVSFRRGENWGDDPIKGLVNRNDNGVLSIVFFDPSGRKVVNTDCLSVSVTTLSSVSGSSKDNRVVAAVGHEDGLTGVRLRYPGQSYLETLETGASASYGSWFAINTGGPATDRIGVVDNLVDIAYAGDTLVLDIGSSHTLQEVGTDFLVFDPPIGVAESGVNFSIERVVRSVYATPEGDLVFSNGTAFVTRVEGDAWYLLGPSSLDILGRSHQTIPLPKNAGYSVNDIELHEQDCYFATDIGVYHATLDTFDDQAAADFAYSSAALSSPVALYRILEGDIIPCKAVVVDPETKHVLVATSDNSQGVLSEIDTSIQQTFRFFNKSSEVHALVAYRNVQGPPDTPLEN